MSTLTAHQPSPRGYDLRFSTRRSEPRKRVRWSGEVTERGKPSASARILDVSATGVFMSTGAPATVGARVMLSFSPPGFSEPVSVGGTVRWLGTSSLHDEAGMGVEFDQPIREIRRLVTTG